VQKRSIVDERGRPLAALFDPPWREWFSGIFSRDRKPGLDVRDPSEVSLFRYDYKAGDLRTWVKVMDADGAPITRIDRKATRFTSVKARFVIRDASGLEIGGIENPTLGQEFIVLDHSGTRIAGGTRQGLTEWRVQWEHEAAGPWPELVAAFFLCVDTLLHPST
jgi:hypothetical protein